MPVSHRVQVGSSARLSQLFNNADDYLVEENIEDSHGTLLFLGINIKFGRADWFVKFAKRHKKPVRCITNNDVTSHSYIAKWLRRLNVSDLHVCSLGDVSQDTITAYLDKVFEIYGQLGE